MRELIKVKFGYIIINLRKILLRISGSPATYAVLILLFSLAIYESWLDGAPCIDMVTSGFGLGMATGSFGDTLAERIRNRG